jgi:D-alanyl-D-alanine endopeptidase (penicillin-binding protein 7)
MTQAQRVVYEGTVMRAVGFFNVVVVALMAYGSLPAIAGQSSTSIGAPAPDIVARPGRRLSVKQRDDAKAPLALRSTVALVVDQDTDEVLLEKNTAAASVPIASITKLMTALVTIEADLPMDEELLVTRDDRTIDRVRSLLRPGVTLTRGQALHLALMSSENHAAQLLGRSYPGGLDEFVEAMNAKAQILGMHDTHFVDPTGLSPDNRSSPQDLVRLVKAAYEYQSIRDFSTSSSMAMPFGKRIVRYANTNRLVSNPGWEIGLQKTGYISAAGRCLVMQAVIQGRRVVMVLLDSAGKYSRIGDAQRIRAWLESPASAAGQVSFGQRPVL